ncbi:MAG TPA: SWIM zinc finger family protein, partial [Pirellulales bacterium]|nr:SWIM zinc finger family protein [Pirellulales bacterium]
MEARVRRARPSALLTLRDRLSRLTFLVACKLLGPEGKNLIQRNANAWEFKLEEDVHLGDDLFRLRFPDEFVDDQPLTVTITLMAEARQRLHWNCARCEGVCEHVGAAFSLILEEKLRLGLAAPPKPRVAVESLGERELVAQALADRAERAKSEPMKIDPLDASRPWTDYTVTSRLSGKTYRVALRGTELGQSYCSCPDFRTNTLGTCKHVLKVLGKVRRRFKPAALKKAYQPTRLAVHLRYHGQLSLWLQVPRKLDEAAAKVIAPLEGR